MVSRRGCALLCLALLVVVFMLPTAAVEALEAVPSLDEPLDAFYDALPDEFRGLLPDDASAAPDSERLREAGTLDALLSRVRSLLGGALPDAGRLLGRLSLCLLFSAIFAAICSAVDGGTLGEAAGLIGRLAAAVLLLSAQAGQLEAVTTALEQMRTMMNAMLPLLGAILAAAGNTGTAAAGSGSLMLFLSVGENLCVSLFLPLIAASSGMAAVGWLPAGERLRGISAALGRLTTWGMGLFGAIASALLAFQTILAAGADTLAARTAKFAVGSSVPILGNAIGDTMRTVGAALGYLRDTVGLLGILVLVVIALPPLIELVLYRTVLRLAEGLAELLGCGGEQRLLSAFVGVSGMLLALLCGALVCFIFAVALMLRVTLATAV